MSGQLGLTYGRDIDALNERRFDDLREFVPDELTHNGEQITREQYAVMLIEDVRAVPDLRYEIGLLVADDLHVARRLAFDGRPQGQLLGTPVNGRRVSFTERRIYRLREGRIEHVRAQQDPLADETKDETPPPPAHQARAVTGTIDHSTRDISVRWLNAPPVTRA